MIILPIFRTQHDFRMINKTKYILRASDKLALSGQLVYT